MLDIADRRDRRRRRAGPARAGVPPERRPRLRRLHGRGRRHRRRRVRGRPADGRVRPGVGTRRCSPSTSRTRTTTAASSRSGRTACCTSALGDGGSADDPGAQRARPASPRSARSCASIRPPSATDAVHRARRQSVRRRRRCRPAHLGARAAQPVALLVRLAQRVTCGSPTSDRTEFEEIDLAPATARPRRRSAASSFGWSAFEGNRPLQRRPARGRSHAPGVRVRRTPTATARSAVASSLARHHRAAT